MNTRAPRIIASPIPGVSGEQGDEIEQGNDIDFGSPSQVGLPNITGERQSKQNDEVVAATQMKRKRVPDDSGDRRSRYV